MKPQIVRADTIDLQSRDAPSAKDHSRQPTQPQALGDGPPAPHQATTLKSAALEGKEVHTRSPRASQDLSGKELQLLHEHDDEQAHGSVEERLGVHRHGEGEAAEGDEDGEGEDGDGDMDDDMMDKISSSPSIDDNGRSSLPSPMSESMQSNSPSPLVSTPAQLPLHLRSEDTDSPPLGLRCADVVRRWAGTEDGEWEDASDDDFLPSTSERGQPEGLSDLQDLGSRHVNWRDLLTHADDPLLDDSFDEGIVANADSYSPDFSDSSDCTESTFNDEEDADESIFSQDPRFVDSGWGGECLREIEEIDFNFVYALHTFVATVEGQANASKGDTMFLLDDSNSYWWLVRIFKDNSIGYLPAEHIETPVERLARLNKHRNIDLSQTMLGDNQEKSRNPLKKAMRRRNAKTVTFSDPTYHDPPERDYSSEEEDAEDGQVNGYDDQAQDQVEDQEHDQNQSQHGAEVDPRIDTVEPLNIRRTNGAAVQPNDTRQVNTQTVNESRPSQDSVGSQEERFGGRVRQGVVRNTDSFFRDDTIETRKISLTPGLLRDDGGAQAAPNTASQDQRSRGSSDTFDRAVAERTKDEKRKEKKPSKLGGLFKRSKDKKTRSIQSDSEDNDYAGNSRHRMSPQPKASLESMGSENASTPASPQRSGQPVRQSSKLQKAPPRMVPLNGRSTQQSMTQQQEPVSRAAPPQESLWRAPPQPDHSPPAAPGQQVGRSNSAPDREPVVSPLSVSSPVDRTQPKESSPISTGDSQRRNMFSPIREVLRSNSQIEGKPERVKKAKTRMALDDSDHSDADDRSPYGRPNQTAYTQDQAQQAQASERDRLSESPVHVSPQQHPTQPPALTSSTSSQEDANASPASAESSSLELVERPQEDEAPTRDQVTPASTIRSNRQQPEWNDASLRAFFDNDREVKDLMTIVHDTTDVKPVGMDHPLLRGFSEETGRLDSMSSRLDGMLRDVLERSRRRDLS